MNRQEKPKSEQQSKLDEVESHVKRYIQEEISPLYRGAMLNPAYMARRMTPKEIDLYASQMRLLAQDIDDLPHRMRSGFAGENMQPGKAINEDVEALARVLARHEGAGGTVAALNRLRRLADPDEVAAAVDAMMSHKERQ